MAQCPCRRILDRLHTNLQISNSNSICVLEFALSFMEKVLRKTSAGWKQSIEPSEVTDVNTTRPPSRKQDIISKNMSPYSKYSNIESVTTTEKTAREGEESVRQTGDWSLYKHYILSVGRHRFAMILAIRVISSALDSFPSKFS